MNEFYTGQELHKPTPLEDLEAGFPVEISVKDLLDQAGQDVKQVFTVIEGLAQAVKDEGEKGEISGLAEKARKLSEAILTKVSERLGSNDGGWYEDKETGEKHYIKFYRNPDQARIEFIANAVYGKLGIKAVESVLFDMNGRLAIASKEVAGAQGSYREEQRASSDVRSGFIADAYLANWDVVGLVYDNIVKDADGNMYRIDNGGSLIFRAQGGAKDYSPDEIPELRNMMNPNYTAGRVFEGLTRAEIVEQAGLLNERLTDEDIDEIVKASGLDSKTAQIILSGLKGRKKVLANMFSN